MPNDVNTDITSCTFIDRDGESSTTRVANGTFTDNADFEAGLTLFESALAGVTNGLKWKTEVSRSTLSSKVPPTNASFRENKWLVSYEDNVNFKRGTFTIPTADPGSVVFISGTDNVDLSTGNGQSLRQAVEAFVRSPDGNDVTVIRVKYVGRNI